MLATGPVHCLQNCNSFQHGTGIAHNTTQPLSSVQKPSSLGRSVLTHSTTMLELGENVISTCGQSSSRVQRVSDDNTVDLADKQTVKDANRPLHASAK